MPASRVRVHAPALLSGLGAYVAAAGSSLETHSAGPHVCPAESKSALFLKTHPRGWGGCIQFEKLHRPPLAFWKMACLNLHAPPWGTQRSPTRNLLRTGLQSELPAGC